ncbi:conjugative transposon protein TraM [Spirosoma sp. HMF4905]|uniref:Conjugative transposon protein TraM n=1 Tax=Spirosoma arboris TaxID=2682092 RepID=A0A7K1SJA7_9BACT|nr:conjugative transposon protein TraM [Spirosoma arboris]MVM33901.1 conjugative transposon protein TraM [Spirosoma arboris]
MNTAFSEAAFLRERKAMLMYPVIVLPFLVALFYLLGGGKGERYLSQQSLVDQQGKDGFNASVPKAKRGSIDGRNVETPGYGKSVAGQVLSSFTNTRLDSTGNHLKSIPEAATSQPVHTSSLAWQPVQTPTVSSPSPRVQRQRTRVSQPKTSSVYSYQPPGFQPGGADRGPTPKAETIPFRNNPPPTTGDKASLSATGFNSYPGMSLPSTNSQANETGRTASVKVSDNLTATRLSDPINPADAFNTAPTMGSRRQAEQAVLSGSNSYGSKKNIVWMIPVVVHEDQSFKSGNVVKLRLTKEISADGVTIPVNTILHAVCQTSDDRLRMAVRNLQLGGQLIPLDLEVYDIDGIAGVNMPGLSNQVGGQMQASAIQGLQIPGAGGLVNTVASQARMSASNAARQPTVKLKAGYNLFLKAQ